MKALVLCVAMVLTGCGSMKNLVTVEKQVLVPMDIPVPSGPSPIDLDYIEWHILKKDNLQDKFKEEDSLYYGMTSDGYKTLYDNILELKKYILQQQKIIEYYKKSVEDQKEKIKQLDK